jgi:hypothetical protein
MWAIARGAIRLLNQLNTMFPRTLGTISGSPPQRLKIFFDFSPIIALKYNVLCQNGILIERHPAQTKVMDVNTPLQLLQSKRSSALIDARKAEAQLTLLNESPDVAGIKTNLLYVVRMFREHIATLDEAIKASPRELR